MKSAAQILKRLIRPAAETLLKVYFSSMPEAGFNPERINRILVFAYHGLGNFIMYTPALKLLRQRYPNARIDLQVGNNTGCEEVLAGAGLFDHIYNLPYSAGIRAWAKRAREIRRARYDLTINEFHSHSWPLALILAASGAPFRAGHVTSPGWSHRFSRYSFAFNLPVRMREDEHEVERYVDLVGAVDARSNLQAGFSLSDARTFIHLRDEDIEFARDFLSKNGRASASVVIGVQPGTSINMSWKQWPIERYREVIERLLFERQDAEVLLFGSPSEVEMIESLARGLDSRVMIAAGKTTVKQVAALIKHCDMLLCNDSGLMHVAAAVGTPVVAIYGPTDIRRTAPLGAVHTVIRHDISCSPCFKLEGDEQVRQCPHHDCIMTITPDEVYARVNLSAQTASEKSKEQIADGREMASYRQRG